MIKAGKLKYRLQLQTLAETEAGTSDIESTYTTIGNIWANIEPLKGLEYFDGRQLGDYATHKITMRYRPALTSEYWLKYKQRRYRIISSLDLGEQFTELMVREEANDLT